MGATASAGTTLSISAGVPGTFDQAGYEALSFTLVGEVTRLDGFGPQWNFEAHNPINLRGTQKVKTNRDPGSIQCELALDTDDAGQILVKAARDSASAYYAVKITTPDGDDYYAQVIVTDFRPVPNTSSNRKMANATMQVSTSDTDVDWVEVLA